MQSDFLLLRFAPLLLDICWKSLLVFAAAGLALLLMRRGSAAGRHALWLSVFVALLCLPALCFWLPQRALPLLPATAVVRPAPAVPSITQEALASPMAHPLPALPVIAEAPTYWWQWIPLVLIILSLVAVALVVALVAAPIAWVRRKVRGPLRRRRRRAKERRAGAGRRGGGSDE